MHIGTGEDWCALARDSKKGEHLPTRYHFLVCIDVHTFTSAEGPFNSIHPLSMFAMTEVPHEA